MSTSRFWGVFGALLIGTGIGRMAGASNALLAPEWTIALGVAHVGGVSHRGSHLRDPQGAPRRARAEGAQRDRDDDSRG